MVMMGKVCFNPALRLISTAAIAASKTGQFADDAGKEKNVEESIISTGSKLALRVFAEHPNSVDLKNWSSDIRE